MIERDWGSFIDELLSYDSLRYMQTRMAEEAEEFPPKLAKCLLGLAGLKQADLAALSKGADSPLELVHEFLRTLKMQMNNEGGMDLMVAWIDTYMHPQHEFRKISWAAAWGAERVITLDPVPPEWVDALHNAYYSNSFTDIGNWVDRAEEKCRDQGILVPMVGRDLQAALGTNKLDAVHYVASCYLGDDDRAATLRAWLNKHPDERVTRNKRMQELLRVDLDNLPTIQAK